MMRYSTNLTAEAVGLTASLVNGVPVGSLLASGSRMAGWAWADPIAALLVAIAALNEAHGNWQEAAELHDAA